MLKLRRDQVFTHRGLEPANKNFYPESSFEAFQDQLSRGFGIEFDPNFTRDGIIVWHDATLERLSEGKDKRSFREVTAGELSQIRYWNKDRTKQGKIPTLDGVMDLIRKSSSKINALHLKGKFQNEEDMTLLMEHLQRNEDVLPRLLIFDVRIETAQVLLTRLPQIQLTPSVAHTYDVKRYNGVVDGTLIETAEAERLLTEGMFGKHPWVWLDEWDLADEDGTKKLYTAEVFKKMRDAGAKISLVTPELHGTSPGLYGGESHPDAKNLLTLFKRIEEIISLGPDAICTDYPEEFAVI